MLKKISIGCLISNPFLKMKDIINTYKDIIIQIATPYSTGTGFYIKEKNLIVTNEHVIRDNREVVVEGTKLKKQLSRVLFSDPKLDLAFLEIGNGTDMPGISINDKDEVQVGEQVLAIGHPFGLEFSATQGIISNTLHKFGEVNYFQHDAALNPGNSGGPLIDSKGKVLGVNTFVIRDGNNIGFSLPANYLTETIEAYNKRAGQIGSRCESCSNLVYEDTIENNYCPHCGTKIELPSQVEEYQAVGIAKTIESILEQMGQEIKLSRRGPNNWQIQEGSAKINIAYYEKEGLITGDAFLCTLPKDNIQPLYEYILRQNNEIEGLTLSVKGNDIIISLIIYDRYLNAETGLILLSHLFEKADHYDDILVDDFGAEWNQKHRN